MATRPQIRRLLARARPGLIVCLLLLLLVAGGGMVSAAGVASPAAEVTMLPAMRAIGSTVDTLFLGGYAEGSFTRAIEVLASDLSESERKLVGRHLDKIFGNIVDDGLGTSGRLRLTYERTVLPGGETGAIRVLAAEAAVDGEMHTAFYFERKGEPGYYDPFGHSLSGSGWVGPLATMRVTSSFGLGRMHPILGRVLPHTGTDYRAAIGTPVRASGDGIIKVAKTRGGYGQMVEIQHPNGYTTRYAHLSEFASGIRKGIAVRQGEVIGYSGRSGRVTGPHLHYEVRRSGRPIDPESALGSAVLTSNAAVDPQWATERRELSRLLAQVPTMVGER
ncbi:MAG TPA: M23 family metallopeptidase [Longimicrobiaceae bacterium]|nr:M23 family metallopeptidase [Longimicrobiaceae bacterium]